MSCSGEVVTSEEVVTAREEGHPIVKQMLGFLLDDLNTAGMFGVIFENLETLKMDKQVAAAVKKILQDVLGLTLAPIKEKEVEMTPEIEMLIKKRDEARVAKNWVEADRIRDQLREMGVDLQDKKL